MRPRPTLFLLALMAACGSSQRAEPHAPIPADPAPAAAAAEAEGGDSTGCIPAGTYDVKVDLATAMISQKNTGMGDTRWCKSILEGVPAQMMGRMVVTYPDGVLTVDWGGPKAITMTGRCAFEVTEQPMPARISFAAGRGTGTTSYSTGSPNHPDESCTATSAKLQIQPAAQAPAPAP